MAATVIVESVVEIPLSRLHNLFSVMDTPCLDQHAAKYQGETRQSLSHKEKRERLAAITKDATKFAEMIGREHDTGLIESLATEYLNRKQGACK